MMRIARAMAVVMMTMMVAAAPARAEDEAKPTIEWDQSTLRLIERGASYARMVRLADKSIACAFDRDGKLWVRRSTDNGMTWAAAVLVAEEPESWLTNSELLALSNGDLLYFWNDRPRAALEFRDKPPPASVQLTKPFRIRMARSSDGGKTWSVPQTLYEAGPTYTEGCWEPAGIE